MSRQTEALRTPKRRRGDLVGTAGWYDYYAAYSPLFVEDMLRTLAIPKDGVALDPWNGSGTTTQVAQDRGISALGYDLNPAAVIVAKARKLHSGVLGSIRSLTAEVCQTAGTRSCNVPTPEPLENWFTRDAAETLRHLEAAIQRLLVCHASYIRIVDLESLSSISDLAAFFYTGLFKVVRSLLGRFRTSNPPWLKFRDSDLKVDAQADDIMAGFHFAIASMLPALESRPPVSSVRCDIDIASSTDLPLKSGSVAAVLTSPPYCTRIDYAVTTSPELAVLGMDVRSELKPLRDRMLGTSTISVNLPITTEGLGPTCAELLEKIGSHPSKAAKSYYLKTYLQYFDGLRHSMAEIARVLQSGRPAAVVVQDSYFKDVRVDLATIVTEMGKSAGMSTTTKVDFASRRTMCSVHKYAKTYRTSTTATESVVVMFKQ